ncbi:hypothetical protein U1Q18_009060 [Sarracenia purpurea var. burkii]
MAIPDQKLPPDGRIFGLFKLPFRHSGNAHSTTPSSSFHSAHHHSQHYSSRNNSQAEGSNPHNNAPVSVLSVARSLLPARRRFRLDPASKLYFPCKRFISTVYFQISACDLEVH